MLRFAYLPESLVGAPPPSLPPGSTARWRPLVPVRIIGPTGQVRYFPRAMLDSAADDTLFPLDLTALIGVVLKPQTGHVIRWRGQRYPLRFGDGELELTDESGSSWLWPAIVGFSPAPVRYPLLGSAGCLRYFDSVFRGENRVVELETNPS